MKITNLTKQYEERTVLDVPELELEEGFIYAVIGGNGSGKTTMARMIAERGADGKFGVKAGYLPQKPFAFNMSLKRNMNINREGSETEAIERLRSLTETLKIDFLMEKNAKGFSGGENARMALARLMMKDYELLILDEPTAAMDVESTLITEKVISEYRNRTGCTVLIITHELNQAKRLSDRVIYLEDGKIIETGEMRQVLYEPKEEKTKHYIDFYGI